MAVEREMAARAAAAERGWAAEREALQAAAQQWRDKALLQVPHLPHFRLSESHIRVAYPN